ncbi:hypothetical protein F5884DRAFT_350033 [Xylogone sp. PMI_703]|nr:hypothetical protein F5884DRAFT_350033 [Xylogone sp. PMI_703]
MAAQKALPPVPALPVPKLKELLPDVSLLPPLSRRGSGPGLIILVPKLSVSSLTIENGIPSPLMKWAEESFVVVEIQESALVDQKNAQKLLSYAVEALSTCEQCEPKGKIGLIGKCNKTVETILPYVLLPTCTLFLQHTRLNYGVAPLLHLIEELQVAVVHGSVDETSTLATTPVPTIRHLAGKSDDPLPRSKQFISYDYPATSAARFSLPFQPNFHYHSEAISHTRNLTSLKEKIGAPYFDLEAI